MERYKVTFMWLYDISIFDYVHSIVHHTGVQKVPHFSIQPLVVMKFEWASAMDSK